MRFLFLLATVLFAVPLLAQAPSVISVSPAAAFIGADVDSDIIVQFDEALNPATVTSTSFNVFGRWSGPAAGTISFEDGNRRIRFVLNQPCASGESVTVRLSKAITDAGGTPLDHAYSWAFWTASRALSELAFQEVSFLSLREPGEGNIISYGAYAGDLDNDGWSDLAVPNEAPVDVRVLLNQGNGTYSDFTTFPLPNGSLPSTNEGGDFNADGNIDIAVGNGNNNRLSIMIGDGTGGFPSITSYQATGNQIRGLAVLDANGDGHEDIVSANQATGTLSYFQGNGDGTFDAATGFDAGGSGERAVASADANADGIMDLFVGAIGSREIILMLGNGNGGFAFSDRIDTAGSPWMVVVGDLDGDGDADVASAGSNGNSVDVVFGDGAGGLASTTSVASGSFTIAIDLGDLDGDGDLDMVSSNFSTGDFYVLKNDGSGAFSLAETLSVNGAGSCAVIHDRDNDGTMEITGIDEIEDRLYFYESVGTVANEVPGGHSADFVVTRNPFRGETTLRLLLDEPQHVRLRVFDVLGREVAVLLDEVTPEGAKVVRWSAEGLPSGVYVFMMETQSRTQTSRVTLLR